MQQGLAAREKEKFRVTSARLPAAADKCSRLPPPALLLMGGRAAAQMRRATTRGSGREKRDRGRAASHARPRAGPLLYPPRAPLSTLLRLSPNLFFHSFGPPCFAACVVLVCVSDPKQSLVGMPTNLALSLTTDCLRVGGLDIYQ